MGRNNGGTMFDVDWHQRLASAYAPDLRAGTVEERAASCARLAELLEDVAGAAHLGPFEAEEKAAADLLAGLFQHCQARGIALWPAFERRLIEYAIGMGGRFLMAERVSA